MLTLFDEVRKFAKARTAQIRSRAEHSSLTSLNLSAWSVKRHFVPVAEKRVCTTVFWDKENNFLLPDLSQQRQNAIYVWPSSSHQGQRQAQRDQDSDTATYMYTGCFARDGSFDPGLGNTLRVEDSPCLEQSVLVYLCWPPGPFLATQYDKEPGGARFETWPKAANLT